MSFGPLTRTIHFRLKLFPLFINGGPTVIPSWQHHFPLPPMLQSNADSFVQSTIRAVPDLLAAKPRSNHPLSFIAVKNFHLHEQFRDHKVHALSQLITVTVHTPQDLEAAYENYYVSLQKSSK